MFARVDWSRRGVEHDGSEHGVNGWIANAKDRRIYRGNEEGTRGADGP